MMKKIILGAFVLLFAINLSAQEINWVSMEKAQELMKKEPRKIIMDAYTVWCGPCKMLDRNTFGHKDVAAYINANYYAVKFNAEGDKEVTFNGKTFKNPGYDPAKKNRRNSSHEFAQFLGVRAYPTIAFFDEDLKLITPVTGYQNPQQLELYLKLFANDKYKNISSQEDFNEYVKTFKPAFGK